MVDGHYGIASLSRSTVMTITLTGKSCWFSVAIASTNALNYSVYEYNNNHHAAFHYNSISGRVNSDDDWMNNGTFARHYVFPDGGPFTAVLTLSGSDRTVSFSVNGVLQSGVWALPTTNAFYFHLRKTTYDDSGNNIAVTDVTVMTADLA